MKPPHFLLIALGSAGDVHPFVGIGRGLAARGHRVTVLANEVFQKTVTAAGLEFGPLGDAETYRRLTGDPNVWHPRKGPPKVFREMARHLPEMIEEIEARLDPQGRRTVMVASSLALGARLLQEQRGVPLVTVHLQPSVIPSIVDPPRLPGAPMRSWTPVWWNRWVWKQGNRLLGSMVQEPLDEIRREMGLSPLDEPLLEWWHSPDLVIGLFPEWFAPPPPDWPEQLVLTDFPLWDEDELHPPDPELEGWLSDGEPPVVLTPGSANRHAADFFQAGITACRRLDRRGLLLTGERSQLPEDVPDGFLYRSFVPFSRVFPRSAAVIHHGGIGTTAQALAAGVPQVIAAFSHDQYDNGARVERLGVGRWLPPRKLSAGCIEKALRDLWGRDSVRNTARDLAHRLRNAEGLRETCTLLESVAGGSRNAD